MSDNTGYVIQNMESNKYLKHNGADQSSDDQYDEVNKIENAESFPTFEHVCYAAFWYADHSKKWRIIDKATNHTFVHDSGSRFKREVVSA